MGSLTFTVRDLNGTPIQNAEVQATMTQDPCGFLVPGCSSGPPYSESGYTDKNGEWIGDIKYSKAPTITYIVQATGYYEQTGSTSLNGANLIDENVWGNVNVSMTAIPSNSAGISAAAPPGQGSSAVGVTTIEEELTAAGNSLGFELNTAGMITAGVIVVIAIAVILIVVFLLVAGA